MHGQQHVEQAVLLTLGTRAADDVVQATGELERDHAAHRRIDEAGELRLVRSTFSYSLYDESNIRLQAEVEGGSLMDVGCYNVSGSR